MPFPRKILIVLFLLCSAVSVVKADESVIFIDPIDSSLIKKIEIPFAPLVLLDAGELPETSTSHPQVHFGRQKFSHLQVSPDGETLAFSVDGESSDWSGLYDIRSKKVIEVSLSFESDALAPYWSGDGRHVVFEVQESHRRRLLRVYDLQGASLCTLDGRWGKNKFFDFHHPFWSDAGDKVYFQVDMNNAYRRAMGLKPIQASTRLGEAEAGCQSFVLRSVEKFMAEVPLKSLPPEAMALSPQVTP